MIKNKDVKCLLNRRKMCKILKENTCIHLYVSWLFVLKNSLKSCFIRHCQGIILSVKMSTVRELTVAKIRELMTINQRYLLSYSRNVACVRSRKVNHIIIKFRTIMINKGTRLSFKFYWIIEKTNVPREKQISEINYGGHISPFSDIRFP